MQQARTTGALIRHYRGRKGWSARQLSEACAECGYPIHKTVIANLETGRRSVVNVAELIVLARVLDIEPTQLIYPLGREDTVEAIPGVEMKTWEAAKWFIGEGPPPAPGRTYGEGASEQRPLTDRPLLLLSLHDRTVERLLSMDSDPLLKHKVKQLNGDTEEGLKEFVRDVADDLHTQVTLLLQVREWLRSSGLTPPALPEELRKLDPQEHGDSP